MSGILTGSPPRTDAQWARDVSQRLTQLEQTQVPRIGSWTLSDQGGDLVATKMGTTGLSLNTDPSTQTIAGIAQTVATATPADTTDTTFLGNLETFFADLNFLSPSFNPAAAAQLLVTQILNPTGLLAGVGDLVKMLTGIDGGNLLDIKSWAQLVPLLTNPLALGGTLIPQVIPLLNAAEHLFGNIPEELLGLLPVNSLTTSAPNRLKNGTFTGPDAIAPANDWTVDMTSTRSVDGTGSAHVVADGTPHELVSGEDPTDRMAVGPGQQVPGTIFVRHLGAVAGTAGPPVALQAQPYLGDLPLEPVTVATYSPATPDLPWPGAKITGTYTVPTDGSVDSVQMVGALTTQALQGEYWFDDGTSQQQTDYTIIPGLPPVLQTLDSTYHSMMDGLASVFRGFPVVGTEIAGLITAAENFNPLNILGSLGSASSSGDLLGIVGHLIDAVKGQPAGTTTNGSLAQLYTAMNQAIHNTAGADVMTFVDTTTLVPINSWSNQIDIVGVGDGQKGQDGLVFNLDGQGGNGGKVVAATLVRGTHYDAGTPGLQITRNSNGSYTVSVAAGTSTPARANIITCAAGSGTQSTHFGSGMMGVGNPPLTYNGKPYPFGGNQNTPGAAGLGPGGGGGGGQGSFFQKGGPGAPGGVYERQLATAITTSSGTDITAPTGGTGHFVSASLTAITVYASGSTDPTVGANETSGMAGYNYYQRIAGVDTKQNNTPLTDSAPFTFTSLTSNTDYGGLLFWAPVDNRGNEGTKTAFSGAGVYKTLNPTPADSPMDSTRAADIAAIVARCMAAGDLASGVTVGISSPFGFLNYTAGTGTAVTSHFLSASQTKMFTSYVICMMVDRGLLTLDDHLSTHLDGYGVDPTIKQMLMMQSGIYDYEQNSSIATNFTLTPTSAMTVDQIIATIKAGAAGATSVFTPGSAFYYTNSNYFVLAKVAESLDPTHRTIDQIITQDIFGPLGMVNSSFRLNIGTPPAPYATGQDLNPILSAIWGLTFGLLGPIPRRDVSSQNPAYIWAAGAIDTTITDMILWGKELRLGTLLSSDMHALRMSTFDAQPATPAYGLSFQGPPTFGYGLGLIQVGSWFGHDGSWLGYDSCTMVEPVTGTVITVYENFQTGAPHVLAALSTIWYEIASYLYPNSANQPGYLQGVDALGSISCSLKKLSSDATGTVYDVGDFEPFTELYTSGGGTNLASVTGKAVPTGLQEGVYVSGIGAGQGGYPGSSLNTGGGPGGNGAGGFDEIFIDKSLLGPTFDASYGVGGGPGGGNGTDTVFRCGSIVLTAQGGKASGPGSATATGIAGLVAHTGGLAGADSTGHAGAGGGHGGRSYGSGNFPGTAGGNSEAGSGGATGVPGVTPAAPSDLLGGPGGGGGYGLSASYPSTGAAGGKGGKYGGGGGGGGSGWDTPGSGQAGGDGGLKCRWA